jgi:hypothetical protein
MNNDNFIGNVIDSKNLSLIRAATGGKTVKTNKVLPGYCKIECDGGSGSAPGMWPPLWQSCLPKIYRVGPMLIENCVNF